MHRTPLPPRLTSADKPLRARAPRAGVLAAVLVATVLAVQGVAFAQNPESQDEAVARERAQLVTRLQRLEEETTATQARAAALGETLVDLAGDGAKLRQRLEETASKVAELEARIADDESALQALTGEQAAIRHQLAGKRQEMAAVLAALQRIGRRPPPALFVGEGGPTNVVRGAIMLNAVLPGLDADAQALVRTLGEAARLSEDEELRWARLRSDLAAVQEERERLTALIEETERRRALSLYERDRASADLVRLAEEADSVEALLARLDQGGLSVAAPPDLSFTERRGGLPLPVAGTVVGRYGDPDGAGGIARGRTIAALSQSTVFAPMPGTVLYAAAFRSYGHVLILDAGGGYRMVLTGMEEIFVDAGATVRAGTPVGRMGSSRRRSVTLAATAGRDALAASRPLLYVELRRDGAAIDSHGWWRETGPHGGRTTE